MTTATPVTIAVRVLLFASYAERLGLEAVDVRLPVPATIRGVLDRVRALPGGEELPVRPLCALNLAHVPLDHPVVAGDEIALLPPLAGG
jgi:molybdopterin converting factor small subunit